MTVVFQQSTLMKFRARDATVTSAKARGSRLWSVKIFIKLRHNKKIVLNLPAKFRAPRARTDMFEPQCLLKELGLLRKKSSH